jgi:Icc-related predicted phosphoesterase
MELILIGDTHGEFEVINCVAQAAPADAFIVQVGDFGYWPHLKEIWHSYPIDRPIHLICGNHEYLPDLVNLKTITEVWDNAFYIPRGTILTLGDKNVGFCGGAGSIDKGFRTPGVDWFPEEAVTDEDVAKFNNQKIDLLVTHCPPRIVIKNNLHIFRPQDMLRFGVTEQWVDYSQIQIQKIWEKLGQPALVCGHMHQPFIYRNIRILDINEVYSITL